MALRSGAEIAAALREAESDGNRAVADRYEIDEQQLGVLRRRYGGLGAREIDAIRTRRQLLFVVIGLTFLGVVAYITLPTAREALAPVGSLRVTSEPAGALVSHAGETLGETPFMRDGVMAGSYPVELLHPYAEPLQTELIVAADTLAEYNFELTLRRASLRVLTNPAGAAIELDGEPTGQQAPYTFADLPAGMHSVAVTLPGRSSSRATIEVLGATEWRTELNRIPTATLTVTTQPIGARVELVDSPQIYTAGKRLPVGEYHVRVSATGYASADLNVFLRAGQDARETVRLQRIRAPLELNLSPATAQVDIRQGNGAARPWRRGETLPIGRLQIRARAPGHRTITRNVDLGADGARLRLHLEPMQFTAGEVIRDALAAGGQGPEMIIVPPGSFEMGDTDGTGYPDERPAHTVEFTQPFAVGRYEITRAEFARYSGASVAADQATLPVTNVSFTEARAYTQWLSTQTGAGYRLPTEAEWEYVARAGTRTRWYFGNDPLELCRHANIADLDAKKIYRTWEVVACRDGFAKAAPVGSLAPNPWGLHDVYGNVSEWVEDCWHTGYDGAPTDGSMWSGNNCGSRMVRGGSWDARDGEARSAYRNSASNGAEDRGLRVARDL